jgi:hypothetical protein
MADVGDRGHRGGVHPAPDAAPYVDLMWCEQPWCKQVSVTYCPLCEKLLCREHDELTPRRMHDCLTGPADARE